MIPRRLPPNIAFAAVLGSAVVLAGCGGSTSSVGPIAAASSMPTQLPSPTAVPASVATAATIGGSSQTTVTLPTVAGIGASIVFPGGEIAGGTTLSATNGPAWYDDGFVNQPSGITIVDYVTFESALGFTVSNFPEFIVTLPAAPAAGEQFYLSLFRPDTSWQYNAMGPAAVSGPTLTFAPEALSSPLPFYPKSVYAVAVDPISSGTSARTAISPVVSNRANRRWK